jgi:alpha-galactosidase
VDKDGFHPLTVGDLPAALAAMNQTNITVQNLAIEAAINTDPELAVAAVALDPLTSAVLNLTEIRAMVAEMFEAEAQWLPEFCRGGHCPSGLRTVKDIHVPADTVGAPVPVDPALAISGRFGKLGE